MNKLEVFKRITKSIFILTLVSLLLFKVIKCVDEYVENPTYTTSKLVNQKEAAFPALTICPINRSIAYNESILNNHGISQMKNYIGYNRSYDCSSNMTWSSRNTALSENDIFENVTLKFDELVDSIKLTRFRGLNVSKSSRSFP